jgi:hypothetical protein
VTGQQGEPVTVLADPPGDGIGPDLTPPDKVPGMDAGEYKRLEKDHRAAVKAIGAGYDGDAQPELFETPEVEPTPDPFADARVSEPQDPTPELPEDARETKAAAKDPREGRGKS